VVVADELRPGVGSCVPGTGCEGVLDLPGSELAGSTRTAGSSAWLLVPSGVVGSLRAPCTSEVSGRDAMG